MEHSRGHFGYAALAKMVKTCPLRHGSGINPNINPKLFCLSDTSRYPLFIAKAASKVVIIRDR